MTETPAPDTLSVDSSELTPGEREMFEQAFMSQHGVVVYRGQRYQVSAMDQNYAEGDEDSIHVTFTLKLEGTAQDRNERL